MGSDGPLAGVRVLDATHVMAGAYCGLLLAQMGADVVKIERPGSGDDFRRIQGRTGSRGGFQPFAAVNHSKRSLALDLRAPRGAELFARLAERADVVVENFRPGVLERLGLGYEALARRNPALVYCSISGFGATGPYRDRGGFDLMAQGMSGIMSLTGEPERPPIKVGVPIADLNAACFGALGVLGACFERLRSGRGQHVDTSLYEGALAYTVWESAMLFGAGAVAGPLGSAHRLAAPYQAFPTSDGFLTLGAANQANWERLCAALGRPDLRDDARFAGPLERLAEREVLAGVLEEIFRRDTTAAWVERLNAAGVPAGPILAMDAVYEDPQARARKMAVETRRRDGGTERHIGVPVKLSRTPWAVRSAAPELGEHSDAVLAEYGIGAEEIASLREAGIVSGPSRGSREAG